MKFRHLLNCSAAAGLLLNAAVYCTAQEAVPATEVPASEAPTFASTAAQALNSLHVNQWVQARPSGELMGEVVRLQADAIVPAPQMRVAVVQDGRIVSETMTTAEGGFILQNVQPGRYTIVARGTQALSVFSLAVLDPQAGRHLPTEVGLPLVTVPAEAVSTMVGGVQVPPNGGASSVAVAPSGDPLGESRDSTTQNYHVAIQADGTLIGQLSRSGMAPAMSDLAGTNVVIYQNGSEIARTQADANGSFAIESLPAGCYGMVASGRAGFAAVGFCAIATGETLSQTRNANGERFVALQSNVPNSLNVELGDATAVQVIEEYVLEPIPDSELMVGPVAPFVGPAGFGGYPGGGGFGGGGAGGGSGLGRFGGLAALGALGGIAAAIAADDDDDDFVNPPTNSPTVTQ